MIATVTVIILVPLYVDRPPGLILFHTFQVSSEYLLLAAWRLLTPDKATANLLLLITASPG